MRIRHIRPTPATTPTTVSAPDVEQRASAPVAAAPASVVQDVDRQDPVVGENRWTGSVDARPVSVAFLTLPGPLHIKGRL